MKGNKNIMEIIKEKSTIKNYSIFIVSFIIIEVFISFLKNSYYMTFFYFIFGIAAYIFTTRVGKEYYLLLCIPEYFISVYMNKAIYNFDYFGSDGLNIFKLHPITIVLLTAISIEFLVLIYEKKFKLEPITVLGPAILIIYAAVTYKNMGQKGIPLLLSNYFEPVFLVTYYYINREKINKTKIINIIKIFIIISFFTASYGLVEYITKFNLFVDFYENSGWYTSQISDGYRIFTTIGHPLNNAFTFLTSMAAVNLYIKKTSLKNFLLIYFSITILATGSRSMFALAVLLIIFSHSSNIKKKFSKDIIFKGISLGVVLMLVFSPIGNTFLNRLDSADNSTQARIILINYFMNNLKSFKVHGLTYGSTALQNVLVTENNENVIPENPYILLFIDLSYLSLLYFAYIIALLFKIHNKINVIVLIIAFGTYNSFSVKGTLNSLFFFIIILSFLYKPSLTINGS